MMIRCLAFLVIFITGCAVAKPAEVVNQEQSGLSRISISSRGDVGQVVLYIIKVDDIEYLIVTGYSQGTAVIKLEK